MGESRGTPVQSKEGGPATEFGKVRQSDREPTILSGHDRAASVGRTSGGERVCRGRHTPYGSMNVSVGIPQPSDQTSDRHQTWSKVVHCDVKESCEIWCDKITGTAAIPPAPTAARIPWSAELIKVNVARN